MDKGAYEIIKLLIQNVDQTIQITFKDGSVQDFVVDTDKLIASLDNDQKELAEKDAMINWLAERCRCFESDYHVEHKQGLFVGTDWYKAAEEAVKKDE